MGLFDDILGSVAKEVEKSVSDVVSGENKGQSDVKLDDIVKTSSSKTGNLSSGALIRVNADDLYTLYFDLTSEGKTAEYWIDEQGSSNWLRIKYDDHKSDVCDYKIGETKLGKHFQVEIDEANINDDVDNEDFDAIISFGEKIVKRELKDYEIKVIY